MSSLILGLVFVTAMQCAAGSALSQSKSANRATGYFLADGLMAEIIAQAYEDPGNAMVFGPESGESGTTRANFNDVDDYHGWVESPPTKKDGAVLPNLAGWQRTVNVEWVAAADVTKTSSSETKAKRISVTVKHNNVAIASRVAVRTKAP